MCSPSTLATAHGVLFVLYVAAAIRVANLRAWPLSRLAIAFVASVVPTGTFIFDRSLRREQQSAPEAS